MLPSSSELAYFLEVANTLNISRAAERLGISQPTLSLAVKRLEDAVGVPLLIRNKSGVRVTRAGQRFATHARGLQEQWEKIREETLKVDARISGGYVIGCHTAVAAYTLHHVLPELLEQHRELEIKLVHDLSRKITEEVISYRVDFGLVVNPVSHPDLVIQEICADEVTLWTSASPTSLQDYRSGSAVLLCNPELMQTQAILKKLEKAEIRYSRILSSTSLETIASLVSKGAGVGILPTRAALQSPALGLKVICANAPKYLDRVCLVYRADAQRSPASRLLAQTIFKRLNSKGPRASRKEPRL